MSNKEVVLEKLEIHPREASITFEWGGHRHNYFSGAFQVNRTRIRPRKIYEIIVSGNKKDRDYLLDFYDRHKGALEQFIFNYDGVDEICAFVEKIEVEDLREIQEIVGFEVTLRIEAMQDNVRPITAEEGEYLPLKPFGSVTLHTDWNTNIVDMGANGRQQTYTTPMKTYTVKLSGHRKHRDAFLEFYRRHGNHVSFLFPYDGEEIEVIFPTTIEVKDKLECGQVVGFECEFELEEVRKPTDGTLEYTKTKKVYDGIPLLWNWRQILMINQYTGQPIGYWTLKSDYGELTSLYYRFEKMVNSDNKIFIVISNMRSRSRKWYDLETGEAVGEFIHYIDVVNYCNPVRINVPEYDSEGKMIHLWSMLGDRQENSKFEPQGQKIVYPSFIDYYVQSTGDNWEIASIERTYPQHLIDVAIEHGYHLPTEDEVMPVEMDDAAVSSDGTLLCMYRDGLFENGKQIVKFPTTKEIEKASIEYGEKLLRRFHEDNTKKPMLRSEWLIQTKYDPPKWWHLSYDVDMFYTDSLISINYASVYTNRFKMFAYRYTGGTLGSNVGLKIGGRIYDKNKYTYYMAAYGDTGKLWTEIFYNNAKYDKVLDKYVSEAGLGIEGQMIFKNGKIESYVDAEIQHYGQDRNHFHVYDDTSYADFNHNDRDIGNGYTISYWDGQSYVNGTIHYGGKPVMSIWDGNDGVWAYYTKDFHLALLQQKNYREPMHYISSPGCLFVQPVSEVYNYGGLSNNSNEHQCLNMRINPVIDMQGKIEKIQEILDREFGDLKENLRLEYTPVTEGVTNLAHFYPSYND